MFDYSGLNTELYIDVWGEIWVYVNNLLVSRTYGTQNDCKIYISQTLKCYTREYGFRVKYMRIEPLELKSIQMNWNFPCSYKVGIVMN